MKTAGHGAELAGRPADRGPSVSQGQYAALAFSNNAKGEPFAVV